MSMIFVTPNEGARVRMPERNSTVMMPEGAWVPDSVHYARLLAAGDIVLADPQPALPTSVPESAAAINSPPASTPAPARASKEK